MNKSVITEVFCEFRENIRLTEQGRKLLKQVSDAYNELSKRLSPEQFQLYNKLDDAIEEEHSEELDNYFTEGFRLGLLIGIECMDG